MFMPPFQAIKFLLYVGFCAALTPASPANAEEGLIAYVGPSRDNREIHLISPDGSGDRLLWSAPSNTDRVDGIGALSWSPDGKSLAFDSGHEWHRSLAMRDIYTIRLQDGQLKRLMNAPVPATFASLPQGSVTVQIKNSGHGRKLEVYVEGAEAPTVLVVKAGAEITVTLNNVADFGPGILQRVRVYDYKVGSPDMQTPCWFDVAAAADVEPGKTVDAGAIASYQYVTCAYLSSPVWRADDGGLMFLQREATGDYSSLNNIWTVKPDEDPGEVGKRIVSDRAWLYAPRFFKISPSPAREKSDDILVFNNAASEQLWSMDVRAPTNSSALRLGEKISDDCTVCTIFDAALLPDNSGFILSRHELVSSKDGSAIYRYDYATKKLTEILRLKDDMIGRIAVSPDGRAIAFERGKEKDRSNETEFSPLYGPHLMTPTSIWIVEVDGSNLRELVKDGRAPSWR